MSADEQIAALVARLERGDAVIRVAEAKGQDVAALEDFWLGLLFEYERAVDRQRQGWA